jgi:hypothetical protein
MARETIYGTYDEDKWLSLISPSSGLANARNCEGVRLEEQVGNPWKSKEDMLASRPVDMAVGEGNAHSVTRHMLDDCFDGCGVSAVDEDESEDSMQTIEGSETRGHPDVNTQPIQCNQQPVKDQKNKSRTLVGEGKSMSNIILPGKCAGSRRTRTHAFALGVRRTGK